MLVRVAVVSACVLVAGLFGTGLATAEELGPEQARAFVIGKLFSYTCFEGTAGQGRIFPDGSVVGTIRIRGTGETRFAALPAGTIRVDGTLDVRASARPADHAMLSRAENRLPELPRLGLRHGLRLLRFLPAQSALAADQRPGRICRRRRRSRTCGPALRPSLDE